MINTLKNERSNFCLKIIDISNTKKAIETINLMNKDNLYKEIKIYKYKEEIMDYNITFRKKDKGIQCIISYKDENGIWRQKSKQGFKAQKDAKPWIEATLKELEDRIKFAEKTDPTLVGITFKELIQMYIEHKKLHREQMTIINIESGYNRFKYLDDKEVVKITKADIQHCVDLMVKEGLSISSIKEYITRIKGVFNYAIKHMEIIEKNPANNVILPEDKKIKKKIKALSKAQLDDLLNRIEDPTYKLISELAGTCGLRIGEIMGLTWDDIDFVNSKLTVNKQWKVIKNLEYGFGDVKRKNSNRTVPIPQKTLNGLKSYKKLYPIHTSKRIFYQKCNTSSVGISLAKLYKKLGYNISIHDLRHTYATHLIANGLDFKTVASLLGHSVQETIRTYSHVNDDMMKKATNVIEKIF